MSDLIDRYEVIELLKRMRYEADSKWEREMITDTENRINAMPSAEPISQIKWERDTAISQLKELGYGLGEKPKKGKWIPHSEMSREYFGTVLVNVEYEYWFCDACGYRVEKGRPMYNFCPNCGADMRDGKGEKNEN